LALFTRYFCVVGILSTGSRSSPLRLRPPTLLHSSGHHEVRGLYGVCEFD